MDSMNKFNAEVLHRELEAAGLEIYGCSSTGRIDWKNPPTAAQRAKADAVLAAHDPAANPPRAERLGALRAKRRAGQALTVAEQQELMDLLLGV